MSKHRVVLESEHKRNDECDEERRLDEEIEPVRLRPNHEQEAENDAAENDERMIDGGDGHD